MHVHTHMACLVCTLPLPYSLLFSHTCRWCSLVQLLRRTLVQVLMYCMTSKQRACHLMCFGHVLRRLGVNVRLMFSGQPVSISGVLTCTCTCTAWSEQNTIPYTCMWIEYLHQLKGGWKYVDIITYMYMYIADMHMYCSAVACMLEVHVHVHVHIYIVHMYMYMDHLFHSA